MIRHGFRMGMAAVAILLGIGTARAADVPAVALVGMELINTSLQPTTDAERARLDMVKTLLAKLLADSGRYRVLDLPPEVSAQAAARPNIAGCAGCQFQWGKDAGADLVVWGTVQKVSNLILNINVYMDDVKTGKPAFGTSVDIRGNTDESWERGIRYLVKYNILKE